MAARLRSIQKVPTYNEKLWREDITDPEKCIQVENHWSHDKLVYVTVGETKVLVDCVAFMLALKNAVNVF